MPSSSASRSRPSGFFGLPLANWVGAVLTAAGGFGIGIATLVVARTLAAPDRRHPGRDRRGEPAHRDAARRHLRDRHADRGHVARASTTMARVHGGLNALGFALPVDPRVDARPPGTSADRATSARRARPRSAPSRPRRRRRSSPATRASSGSSRPTRVRRTSGRPRSMPRPVVAGLLLMVPAAIAAIGAWHRSGRS